MAKDYQIPTKHGNYTFDKDHWNYKTTDHIFNTKIEKVLARLLFTTTFGFCLGALIAYACNN